VVCLQSIVSNVSFIMTMKIGGIDKVKYFMHQIDRLLPKSIDEVFEKWDSDSCPALKLKLACAKDVEFDLPKSMGGLKTTGLVKGVVLCFLCSIYLIQECSLKIFFDR